VKITEFALRNPLVVVSLTLATCLFGLFGYARMGVATLPNINFPAVAVVASYPGADPETVETNVTKPLEDAIAALPNVDRPLFISTSQAGFSQIIVYFTDQADPDFVAIDVQRVVNAARASLPSEVEPPSVVKFDVEGLGTATIILSGPQSLVQLQEVAENLIQPRLNAVPGVASATVRSGVQREVQIKVDDEKLRARGLAINHVVNALQTQQVEVPAGAIADGTRNLSVYFDSLATSAARLNDLVVAQTPAGPVFLKDVATVEDTIQKRNALVRVDGVEGVGLTVVKLGDASSIAVVDGVRKALDELRPQLPPGSDVDVVIDASNYTRKSFKTVRNSLIEAVIVTGLILLLFLHTWRSTLIVLISIPVSLLVTLVVMSLLGYTLNLMTMIALTVSVGILVDDSIVVLENIYRHLGLGKSPFQAALDGRGEIGKAAMTITLVDVVVYLPMAVMTSGIPRQVLAPFALVITTATLASLVVSFLLTPLLASRFLRAEHEAKTGSGPLSRFGRAWDRGFERVEHGYARLLGWSLPRRWLIIALGTLSFAIGIALPVIGLIGQDFFPSGDQSEVDIEISMPPATTLAATNAVALAVEQQLKERHEVVSIYTGVGGGAGSDSFNFGSNRVEMVVSLVPVHERKQSAKQLVEEYRALLDGKYPGARFAFGMPNAFGFGGFEGAPIQVQVKGRDPAVLDALAAQVEAAVRAVPGATDVRSANDNRAPQLRATVDWTRAADLGVMPRDAGIALRAALDGFTSNQTQLRQTGKSSIPIRVLRDGQTAMNPEDVARVPVASQRGGIVELGQFVTFRQSQIPNAIAHVDRQRSVTISARPTGDVLVGDLNTQVRDAVKAVPVGQGYSVGMAGQGEEDAEAFTDLFLALMVGMGLMYILMLMLFGSVTLPLAVMGSLPLAVVGALGALAITRNPFTIFSMIGIVVLSGLVGKNAILLVDYTDRLRKEGMERNAALRKAGPTRLRPIIMTTVSVMAALMPIASGLEEGSELLVSVAVVLIGGLLTSTVLTLVFVPAMYTIFDDLEKLVIKLFTRGKNEPPALVDDAPHTHSNGRAKAPAAAGVAGLLALLLVGCTAAPSAATVTPGVKAAEKPTLVSAAPAERTTLVVTNSYTGDVRAKSSLTVVPKIPGRIEQLKVDLGSVVNQGDIIAELDKEQARLNLRQSEASLTQARSRLATLKAGPRPEQVAQAEANARAARARVAALEQASRPEQVAQARAAVDAARARLAGMQSGRPETIAQAQANVDAAEARLAALQNGPTKEQIRSAEIGVEQAKNALYGVQTQKDAACGRGRSFSCEAAERQAFASEEAVKAAEQQLKILTAPPTEEALAGARAGVEAAKQQLAIAQHPASQFDVAQAANAIRQAEAQAGLAAAPVQANEIAAARAQAEAAEAGARLAANPYTKADLDAAEAQVAQAETGVEIARQQLQELTVVAPVAGVVSERFLTVGAIAGPTTPIVSLASPEVEVVFNVDEAALAAVEVGAPTKISLPALGAELVDGKIAAIAPTVDPRTRTTQVKVAPDPAAMAKLKPGMFAQITVESARKPNALVIPRAALLAGTDPAVFVVADGHAKRVPVELGLRDRDKVEVLKGVTEGEQVVLDAANLRDGAPVTK
jgi:HAE1 family hydrophobic/amphiphilic exporter-1